MDSGDARPFYALSAEAALTRLGSRAEGLESREAAARLEVDGPNRLPKAEQALWFDIAVSQFKSPFIYLLLAASGISMVIGQTLEAAFIVSVMLMNASIGGWQEWRAERQARSLHGLVRGRVVVLRDGGRRFVDAETLVSGDIVEIESGLRIPADIRLLEATGLVVDESQLTGESVPVEKSHLRPVSVETPLAERSNMLFSGTVVRRGRARGLVVATGARSEVGRLTKSVLVPFAPTPLLREMSILSRKIGVLIVVLIAVISGLEFMRGNGTAEVFLVAVALAVSAIPEALPIATTVVLSISMRRLSMRNVIVRHMAAVEGLGACTVIATDKTGTLTVNRLKIDRVWIAGPDGMGSAFTDASDSRTTSMFFAAARCSEGHGLVPDHSGEEIGDAVDLAFLRAAASSNYDAVMEAETHRGRIAYEPEKRYAASFHDDGGVLVAYVKGAPETVLALCGSENWTQAQKYASNSAIHDMASNGYRVIAVAAGPVDRSDADALHDLTLLGFAGLIDPLRPEAASAVHAARQAGLRVVMITGDHPATARAIGRQLALIDNEDEAAVLSGSQLHILANNWPAFDQAVAKATVFARTEPLQKLAIVESLQRQGHVVAVTGDGVNDAPALHAADIGVAMGRGGTDAAREAADLVLVDDNFASIVAGIEEGRAAYSNLRKVVLHCISTGGAGLLLMLLSASTGMPLPLTALQLLWLNLVSNGIQDIALGFEASEPGLLQRGPRASGSALLDRAMVEQILLSGATIGFLAFAAYAVLLNAGFAVPAAQGMILWLTLWFENAHVLNCRSESRSLFALPLKNNWMLVGGVIATQLLQIVVSYTPGANALLRLDEISIEYILVLALPALLLTAVIEAYKLMKRNAAASGMPA